MSKIGIKDVQIQKPASHTASLFWLI